MEEKTNQASSKINVEASVRPVTPTNNLVGFASIKIADCFAVNDIPVKTGKNGLYFDNPAKADGQGGYRDICLPITADFRQKILTAITEAYVARIEKLQTMGEAQRGVVVDRPSVTKQLENGIKAANQHVTPKSDTPKRDVAVL